MYIPPFDELKNASKEKLLKIIQKTQRKLRSLRFKMESPFYNEKEKVCPSKLTIYSCDLDFLNIAKLEYYKKGGKHIVNKREERGDKFNENLNDIKKIVLSIQRFPSPPEVTTADLKDNMVIITPCSYRINLDKEDFLAELKEIKVGEWRKVYSPKRYGVLVLDGSGWSLDFEYKSGKRESFCGCNSYPYNFELLLNLMGTTC